MGAPLMVIRAKQMGMLALPTFIFGAKQLRAQLGVGEPRCCVDRLSRQPDIGLVGDK
jgi:hypothetical protein